MVRFNGAPCRNIFARNPLTTNAIWCSFLLQMGCEFRSIRAVHGGTKRQESSKNIVCLHILQSISWADIWANDWLFTSISHLISYLCAKGLSQETDSNSLPFNLCALFDSCRFETNIDTEYASYSLIKIPRVSRCLTQTQDGFCYVKGVSTWSTYDICVGPGT